MVKLIELIIILKNIKSMIIKRVLYSFYIYLIILDRNADYLNKINIV